MTFDHSLDFEHIDFREHPELYRIGKGEQGVLLVPTVSMIRKPQVRRKV
jgi:hypothetical protein